MCRGVVACVKRNTNPMECKQTAEFWLLGAVSHNMATWERIMTRINNGFPTQH